MYLKSLISILGSIKNAYTIHIKCVRRIQMNQPKIRFIETECIKCKCKMMVRQVYNKRLSDWETVKIPICEDCKENTDGSNN